MEARLEEVCLATLVRVRQCKERSLWAPGNDLTDATARRMASARKNRAVGEIGPVVLHAGLVDEGDMSNVL
jgi:hypothetical protein